MPEFAFRPYAPADRTACLAIFDGNVPEYFAQEERAGFVEFLERVDSRLRPYLVLAAGSQVIACGGLSIDPANRCAAFSWGMVDRAHHGAGHGTRLLEARIALAKQGPDIDELRLATSQHTRAFYERFGFEMTRVTPDGFAPGLDQWDVTRPLGP